MLAHDDHAYQLEWDDKTLETATLKGWLEVLTRLGRQADVGIVYCVTMEETLAGKRLFGEVDDGTVSMLAKYNRIFSPTEPIRAAGGYVAPKPKKMPVPVSQRSSSSTCSAEERMINEQYEREPRESVRHPYQSLRNPRNP